MAAIWRSQGLSAEATERLVYWGEQRASYPNARVVERRVTALRRLLPGADVSAMLGRAPMLVTLDVEVEAPLRVEVVRILLGPAAASAGGAEAVLERYPRLLMLSPWRLVGKIEALAAAVPGVRVDRAIVRQPALLYRRPRTVAATFERLAMLLRGAGADEVAALAESSPGLLMVRPQRLSAAMGVLMETLGADGSEADAAALARRVAMRNPRALTLAPATLRSALGALAAATAPKGELRAGPGAPAEEHQEIVSRVLRRAPNLLTRSPSALGDNAHALAALLPSPETDLPDAAAVSTMVVRQPSLLGYKSATLATKLNALKVLLPSADVGRMVRGAPGLMASNVEHTLPRKIESLHRAFTPPLESREELEELLESTPSLLTMQPELLASKMQRLLELCPDLDGYKPTTMGRFVLNSKERIERLAFVQEMVVGDTSDADKGGQVDGAASSAKIPKASTVLNMPQALFMRRYPGYADWARQRRDKGIAASGRALRHKGDGSTPSR